MMITIQKITVKSYLTKSSLPASDYVLNPYIGCPHGCIYCYASFMKRFSGHTEPWGEFLDVKECERMIDRKKIKGKSVFLASVTDCYNAYEETYGVTRAILEQLQNADCELTISTKSSLVLRDLDLLKKFPKLKVAISINTLDERLRSDMDQADTISNRLLALKKLHQAGIHTVLFLSPILPYLTDWKAILDATKDIVKEVWLENLNLRGSSKQTFLSYIRSHYPEYMEGYQTIYQKKDISYWEIISTSIEQYCKEQGIYYQNYFYHKKLVNEKKAKEAFKRSCKP